MPIRVRYYRLTVVVRYHYLKSDQSFFFFSLGSTQKWLLYMREVHGSEIRGVAPCQKETMFSTSHEGGGSRSCIAFQPAAFLKEIASIVDMQFLV